MPENTDSSDISLTQEEEQEVLRQALEKKKAIESYKQQQERRKLFEAEMMRKWDSTDMLNYIQWRAKAKLNIPFTLDDKNHNIVRILCRYFTKDKRFEEMGPGWNLEKGIILAGNVGTGKTTLMKLFNANQKASYNIISCRKMADQYADMGPEMLHIYSRKLNIATSIDTFYQNQVGACFDDLGTERQGKHYGDAANVMEQIILNRYDNTNAPWYYTHITTNLTADEIENYYGTRVRSRMREMFNLITLEGEDRRK